MTTSIEYRAGDESSTENFFNLLEKILNRAKKQRARTAGPRNASFRQLRFGPGGGAMEELVVTVWGFRLTRLASFFLDAMGKWRSHRFIAGRLTE